MDPFAIHPFVFIVGLGFLGGLVIAFLFLTLQRRSRTGASVHMVASEPVSADVINVSRIRVAGVGGLGLVAMAAAVALNVPRIGQSLAAGLVLGTVSAAVLILWRRHTGPLPSSAAHAGANTTLAIDDAAEPRSR
jgi:hypothetical protein